MAEPSADPKNHLLASLSVADFALVGPNLESIALAVRFVLEESNRPVKYVYFPEAGSASVVAKSSRNRAIEVGLIGREGMCGINVVMGNSRSRNSTYMQAAGNGQRIGADDLRSAMEKL